MYRNGVRFVRRPHTPFGLRRSEAGTFGLNTASRIDVPAVFGMWVKKMIESGTARYLSYPSFSTISPYSVSNACWTRSVK